MTGKRASALTQCRVGADRYGTRLVPNRPSLPAPREIFQSGRGLPLPRARDILGENPAEKILEVGSAGEGFGKYADVTLTAVEPRAEGAPSPGKVRVVRASGTSLPFRDRGFDAVLSVDVLEHLRSADRPVFLRECPRVAARRLVLIFPSEEAAEGQDRELWPTENFLRRALTTCCGSIWPMGSPPRRMSRVSSMPPADRWRSSGENP